MAVRILRSVSRNRSLPKVSKLPPKINRKVISKRNALSKGKRAPAKIERKTSKAKKVVRIKLLVKKAPSKAARVKRIKAVRATINKTTAAPRKLRTREKPSPKKSAIADQITNYEKLIEKYMNKYSTPEMKEILRKNDQGISGTREELAKRLAIGASIGKVPRCPKCFGGRLRFSVESGFFTCPGYMDDTRFRFCNKTFALNEIPRSPFVF